MATQMSQQALLDALVSHQAYLYRLSSTEINNLLTQFDSLSNEMISKLRDLLDELSDTERSALMAGQYTTPALKEIRTVIQSWQSTVASVLLESFTVSATALAVYEATYQAKTLTNRKIEPNGKTLFNKAKKTPLSGGILLDSIFARIADDTRLRVEQVIRDGLSKDQTNQQIIQRIKGKKALNYQDGLLDQSRSQIATMVRTARSHVSNVALNETYTAIGVEYVKFIATLDSRTSKICMGYSDKVYRKDEPHPVPPLHPNCRSILIPVTDEKGKTIGKRPFNNKVNGEGEIGVVDSNTTFKGWFDKQDAAFQKSWLGPTRYKLFKEGKYSLDKFIDPLTGQPFTLAELKKLDEEMFKRLGL
ncbi:minor capsid protein [Acinetobacter baumannii]|uniref:minor capsid protein n=1 Tax=Acinetobacter baumannii TaxID=470 RepID=UPI0019008FCC|nr:minor capsid protein [Acinetobacter baumannii]MBJ9388273.1 minor capsid protein [Acinetobacter baumannii]MBJ9432331.1 minor capsid protein [Acinetobacter baumannii]